MRTETGGKRPPETHGRRARMSSLRVARYALRVTPAVPLWLTVLLAIISYFPLLSPSAYGAGGDILWQFRDSKTGKQEAMASAVDSAGNMIVAGYQNLSGGSDTNDDFYVIKVKADGSGLLWSSTFHYQIAGVNVPGSDRATALAIDSGDNIIVTGYVWNGTNYDIQTIKYSPNGAVLWQHTYNGSAGGNDHATAVAVDSSNNIYVGGYTQNTSGNDDYIILKYWPTGPNGTVPVWQVTYDGTAHVNDRLTALAATSDGVIATGYSWNGSNFDYLTVKYDFNGTKKWEQRCSSLSVTLAAGDAEGLYLRTDSSGNAVVTGYVSNSTDHDIYTVKYNGSTGAVIWGKIYNGGHDDDPASLWIDGSGDVYMTGYTYTLTGRYNIYTARYSGSSGTKVWDQSFDSGGGNDDFTVPFGIVTAEDVFLTGKTYVSSTGGYIWQTLKYKKDNGNLLWQVSFSGAGQNNEPVGIALSSTGRVCVAGWSDAWTSGSSDYDYYVIEYDAGLLNAPTGLVATAVSNTEIDLTWNDNSSNPEEDGFIIERKTGIGGTYSQIGTVGKDVVSFKDTTVQPNNYYYYRVYAYSSTYGNSPYSNEAHALSKVVSYDSPSWTYLYNDPDNGNDYATGIAAGPDDNPVVTGSSFSNPWTTGGSSDYYTVKLSRADRSVIWSDRYDDANNQTDDAMCVAVDINNNVTVSGFSYLDNAGIDTNHIYTIRYPASGPPESWHNQFNSPSGIDDRATSVAVAHDNSGSSVIVGYGSNVTNNDDIYVIKYKSDGTLAWSSVYDGGGNDYPAAVTLDSSNNVLVTGYSWNGSHYGYFTRKYDSSGNIKWTKFYNSSYGDAEALSLAVDAAGNVYVTGYAVNSAGNEDFYTIRYNGADGTLLWQSPYDGPAHGNDEAKSVRVDPIDGAVVVAGTTLRSTGNNNFHIVRYNSSDGTVIWDQNFENPGHDDNVAAMELDPSGYIYIAGDTNNGSNSDIMSLIYNYDGTFLQAMTFDGNAHGYDSANALAVNSQGEAFIAGYSTNAGGNTGYVVLKHKNNYMLVPIQFTATAQSDYSKVNLSWVENTAGTYFNIYRAPAPCPSTSGSGWTLIYTTPATGIYSYQDAGLDPEANYCYMIESFIGSLTSRRIVTSVTTNINAPTLGSPTGVTSTGMTIPWSSVNLASSYSLQYECIAPSGCSPSSWTNVSNCTAITSVSCSVNGLSPGTQYDFQVNATDALGRDSVWSTPLSATTIPTTPGNLTANVVSATEIDLSWSNVTGETGFYLQRLAADCSTVITTKTIPADTTTYQDNGLTSGVTYCYKISAYNTSGTSLYSSGVAQTTLLLPPTGLVLSGIGQTSITLSWNNETGNTGYRVERSTDGVNFAQVGSDLTANMTTYTDNTLTPGTLYYYQIRAKDAGGYSSPSTPPQSATTIPATPALNSPWGITTSGMALSWSGVTGASSYTLQYECLAPSGCTPSSWTNVSNCTATTATSCAVSGLASVTRYNFQVKANDASGDSPWSNQVSAYTLPTAPALNSPPTGITTSGMTLSWSSVTGVSSYTLQFKPSGGTYSNASGCTAITGTSCTVTGLAGGVQYYFEVKATDPSGDSAWSNEVSAPTLPAVPSAPALYSPTSITTSGMTLSWSSITGASSYTLQYECLAPSGCTPSSWTNVSNCTATTGTSCAVGSLSSASQYNFQVKATNTAGDSPWSNQVSAYTLPTAPALNSPPTGITTSGMTLSWSSVTGVSSYTLQFKPAGGTYSNVSGCTTITGTSCPVTGLSSGVQYYFQVKATDPSGDSVWSNQVNAYTLPTAPTLNSPPTSITTSGMTLSWSGVTGASSYTLQYECLAPSGCTPSSWTNVSNCTAITGASCAVSALASNNQYNFQVKATDASGDSAWSNQVAGTTLLSPPTLNSLSGVTQSSITLSWTPNVTGNTGYRVERSTNGVNWAQVGGDLPADTLTYTDTTCSSGTLYYYQVKTKNAGGYSAPSNVQNAMTLPSAPTLNSPPTGITTSGMTLSWSSVTGASSYTLQYECLSPSGCAPLSWTNVSNCTAITGASCAVSGLASNNQYNFQVKATDATGDSAWSNQVNAYTLPSAPTLNSPPTNMATSSMTLSWSSIAGASSYTLQYKPSGGTFTNVPGCLPTATSCTANSLSSGTLYYFQVKATGATADSAWSNQVSSMTLPAAPVLSDPTNILTTSMLLSWTSVTGAASYTLQFNSGGAWANVSGCTAVTTTSCTASGLHSSVQYNFQVKATDASGDSAWSNQVTATTAPDPQPFNGTQITLSASAVNSQKVALTWTDYSSEETGFDIEVRVFNGSYAKTASVGPGILTYTDTTVQPGTQYLYRVRASKTYGTGFASGLDSTWSKSTYVYNSSGSAAVTPANNVVTLNTQSLNLGSSGNGHYNSSKIYQTNGNAVSGDFDIQADYNLPNGQVVAGQYHVYARVEVDFTGTGNYAFIERNVSNSTNSYQGCVDAYGTLSCSSVATSDTSGKLRIARSGNVISTYIWTGGSWSLIQQASDTATTASTFVGITQYAQENEAVNLTTNIDNVTMITGRSPYSNEAAVTTPAYATGDTTCQ